MFSVRLIRFVQPFPSYHSHSGSLYRRVSSGHVRCRSSLRFGLSRSFFPSRCSLLGIYHGVPGELIQLYSCILNKRLSVPKANCVLFVLRGKKVGEFIPFGQTRVQRH